MWRYSSLGDLWKLAQATLFSSLLIVAIMAFLSEARYVPRSIILLDALLTLVLAGGLRMFIRTVYSLRTSSNLVYGFHLTALAQRRKGARRVLIIGAGDAGEKILREILDNPQLGCDVVGFLDDDERKRGRSVHGVPVLGCLRDLNKFVDQFDVQEVLIAILKGTPPSCLWQ